MCRRKQKAEEGEKLWNVCSAVLPTSYLPTSLLVLLKVVDGHFSMYVRVCNKSMFPHIMCRRTQQQKAEEGENLWKFLIK